MSAVGIAEALIGVAGAALLALAVYRYRGLVTYDITSLYESFKVEKGNLNPSNEWGAHSICMERIDITNHGWTDIENFKLHIDSTENLLAAHVRRTDTLSKEVVSVQVVGQALEISAPVLPRNESLRIEIAYRYLLHPSEYRTVKGGDGKYRFKRKSTFESDRKNLKELLASWVFSALIATIALT